MMQARGRSFWVPVGVALALLGAGALLLASAYEEPLRSQVLGRVAPANESAVDPADISSNNSPAIARSPRDPRRLAISNRIDSPRYSCALHVSSDAGATWKQTPLPAPPGETKCYAPDVAFDADGTLYMSFVTLRGAGNVPNAAWIVTSKDGGTTLSRPRRVLGRLVFQVRLATDPATRGRVYLSWVQGAEVGLYRFSGDDAPIRTMRSDDGGRAWGSPVRSSSPRRARVLAPSPAVGPDGELYV
ncbi:MAG: sialidase family protein, partial [Solirubrobacteraceae bacterium]